MHKKQKIMILVATIALGTLAACSNEMKSKLGLSKAAPNEFSVSSNPPLIEPPILHLPEPGVKKGDVSGSINAGAAEGARKDQGDLKTKKHSGVK